MAEAEPSRCVPGAVRTSSPEPAAEPPISASMPPAYQNPTRSPPPAPCFLPSAFCLLLSSFCFLPSAFCLLPPAACLLISAFCRLTPSQLRPRLVKQIERRMRLPSAAFLVLSAFVLPPPAPFRPRPLHQLERRLRLPSKFLKSYVRHYLPH